MFIELTQKQRTKVCKCHKYLTEGKKWFAQFNPDTQSFYAATDGIDGFQLLHRIIMSADSGQFIDHINRDTLDNRCCNLRFVTRQQNQANRGKQRNNTTGFKGVCLNKPTGKWAAYIGFTNKSYYIGLFEDAATAALAYDDAAITLFGEMAGLNFPEGVTGV